MSDTLDTGGGPPSPPPPAPGGPPGGPAGMSGGGPGGPGGPMMAGQPPPGFGQGPRPSVPGAGTRAGGAAKLIQGIRMIQMAMLELPIGSEIHKDASKAVDMLSKHLNMSKETEGVTQTGVGQLLQQIARMAMMGRGQQAQQGRPAMPPTTPLPGA